MALVRDLVELWHPAIPNNNTIANIDTGVIFTTNVVFAAHRDVNIFLGCLRRDCRHIPSGLSLNALMSRIWNQSGSSNPLRA